MLADIALPVAVDREFTYLVPPDLAEAAVPGVRVIVPFGRRHATGLIVRIPEATAVKGLRPIMDILDAEPVVSAELLHLCLWIAEYYMAPPGTSSRPRSRTGSPSRHNGRSVPGRP